MRRASIYALWVLATAGLVTIGLIGWAPWSTGEDAESTRTQDEARAAAEGLLARSGTKVAGPECTLDRRASNGVTFTFDCAYTEILYPGLNLDVPFEKERHVRVQGALGPTDEFTFSSCRPESLSPDQHYYFTFADC